jgi:hypothetical protein
MQDIQNPQHMIPRKWLAGDRDLVKYAIFGRIITHTSF